MACSGAPQVFLYTFGERLEMKENENGIRRRLRTRAGQGLVEYTLILILAVLVVIAATRVLGVWGPGPINNASNTLAEGN